MRPSTKHLISLLAVTVACGLFSQSTSAQFSSTTRTGSASGNALTSGSSATGTAGGTGASSGFGGVTAGGANNQSMGNAAGNRTNANGASQLGQSAFSQGNTQNAFIGGRSQQQGFIGGNQRTGQQQNNRQQQTNRQGNFGQNDFNNANGQGQQNQTDPRRAIRPSFKVAFDQPQPVATEIRSTLQPRFDSLSQSPSLRGVTYELDAEGVVVLSGSVDTPSQRRLAENVVKLEPGVKKVRNELTLNEPAEKP